MTELEKWREDKDRAARDASRWLSLSSVLAYATFDYICENRGKPTDTLEQFEAWISGENKRALDHMGKILEAKPAEEPK